MERLVDWEKTHTQNLKVENYALFDRFSEDLSLENSLSDHSQELLQRDRG